MQGNERLGELPPELMAQVVDGVDDFPISLEEAKEIREQLIGERQKILGLFRCEIVD